MIRVLKIWLAGKLRLAKHIRIMMDIDQIYKLSQVLKVELPKWDGNKKYFSHYSNHVMWYLTGIMLNRLNSGQTDGLNKAVSVYKYGEKII